MSIITDYKNRQILPQGLVALYTSRLILLVASGFMGLFLPVFLLIQYQSLEKAIVFYLWTWGLYLFLAAVGAKLINVFGIKKCLIYSIPFSALFYLSLYFLPGDVLRWSIIAGLSLTLYRMLYWVPYDTNLAKFSETKNRGKQLGILDSTSTFLGIVIPLISGFLITEFGFKLVFVLVIVLTLIASVPLRFLPDLKEKFTWSYKKTWQEFFRRDNRKMMIAYMADGAENWIGGVLWPIFIWQLLQGQYLAVGAISSAITLVAVILKLIMGDFSDKYNKKKMMVIGSVLYSIGWIFKIFIVTAFQIFLASTYHNFTVALLRSPFDTLTWEKAADRGHYVDEFSTLREMYLQFGRVLIILLVLFLLHYLSLNLTFALAAIASLLVNLLPKHGPYESFVDQPS